MQAASACKQVNLYIKWWNAPAKYANSISMYSSEPENKPEQTHVQCSSPIQPLLINHQENSDASEDAWVASLLIDSRIHPSPDDQSWPLIQDIVCHTPLWAIHGTCESRPETVLDKLGLHWYPSSCWPAIVVASVLLGLDYSCKVRW